MKWYGVACVLQSVPAGALGAVLLTSLWHKGLAAAASGGFAILALLLAASAATAFLAFEARAHRRARLPFAVAELAWALLYGLLAFGA